MSGSAAPEAGRADLAGSLAVVFASACWATSGLFVKLILTSTGVSALALAFWRDLVTFVVLLLWIGGQRPAWLRVGRADLRWLAAMGCSLGLFHVCWNLGVFLNGAAVATVQQAAMPAIVAVVAWLAWREPLTWTKMAAILLTFAGTILVSGLDVLGQAELSPGGFLVGLGIPLLYAAWNLFGKQVRSRNNPSTVLLYAFGFATLALLPFQLSTPPPRLASRLAGLSFAGLVGVPTLVGFSIYTWALGRLKASVAAILAMSEIAFVAVYAYLLLGERLTASQVLGAGLVVGGVLLLGLQGWRRRAA